MTETMTADALYAYAVVGPAGPEVRAALGPAFDLVGDDELAVVAGRVSLAEFGEDVLPKNLNDRPWLEAKARLHESVIERLLPIATVVPLRFGSIHRDAEAVEAFLASRRDDLRAAAAEVRGCVELGVKAWLAEPPREEPRAAAAPTSGREYLERQRQARDSAALASDELGTLLAELHERFLAVSEAGVLNRPQSRELTGRDEPMLMNAAYLVRREDSRLAAEIDRANAAQRIVTLELTGPWAPYNFVGAVE